VIKKRVLLVAVIVLAAFVGGFLGKLWAQKTATLAESLGMFSRVVGWVMSGYVEPVDGERLIREAIRGMLSSLDPYSEFLDEADFKELKIKTEAQFGGIGIHIGLVDGELTVIAPIEGTPAERAGIRGGDRIAEIEGKSTEGFTTEQAVKLLRGEPGTKVNIKVARPGVSELLPFELTRAVINIKAVPFAGMVTRDIGYIRLADFSRVATNEMTRALDSLFAAGAKKLILDLTSNGGGLLREGRDVADLFLPAGRVIVKTKGRLPDSHQEFIAETEAEYGNYPMVVLVDRSSASAAEIVAGALQDWERAVVVGDTTFGKGSVQTIQQLGPDIGAKITTAYWYTPSGRCINRPRERSGVLKDTVRQQTREVFHTLGSLRRVVYGGGAIAPDVFVPEAKPAGLAARVVRDAYFDFAVDYVNSHPGVTMEFEADGKVLDQFKEYLRTEKKVQFTDAAFDSSAEAIAGQLEIEVASKLHGIGGAYQMRLRHNPSVHKAIELLERASSTEQILKGLR